MMLDSREPHIRDLTDGRGGAEPKKEALTRARGRPSARPARATPGEISKGVTRIRQSRTYGPHRPVLSRLRSDTLSLDSPLVPVPRPAIQLTVILTVGACLVG